MKKYVYSWDEEHFSHDEFNTIEEALSDAKDVLVDIYSKPKVLPIAKVWVGEVGKFEPIVFATYVIDNIRGGIS